MTLRPNLDTTVPTLLDQLAKCGSGAGGIDQISVSDPDRQLTYHDLLDRARRLAGAMQGSGRPLAGERVVMLVPPTTDYVVAMVAIWLLDAVAVPMRVGMPGPEIEYVLDDTRPVAILTTEALRDGVVSDVNGRDSVVLLVEDQGSFENPELPVVSPDDDALILYTSGTTGRPKGVVHTHSSLAAQMRTLVEAWEWQSSDSILLSLPLHHIHGIVNIVGCALWSGARCHMHERFDPVAVWETIAGGSLTLYMAVPTIYRRLIDTWTEADAATQHRWSEGARGLRLMVSGSAALPVPTLERWHQITGHTLLERYGMTEIGMALSNRLDARDPGRVGWPLPGVDVRVVSEDGLALAPGEPGELEVSAHTVFSRYWDRPEDTAASFSDGWFRTGDVVQADERGSFAILGRASIDIIKSGGEKLSALEIEATYRTHPAVEDCAVVGVPDSEWGERVCMAYIGDAATTEQLRSWGKEQLADYKVPREFARVDALPRNAMGKVVKADVTRLFDAP